MKYQYHKYIAHLSEYERRNLQEELHYLQMRLRQIGYNGDCAYEKKLAGYYNNAILRCKEKLNFTPYCL